MVCDIDSKDFSPVLIGRNNLEVMKLIGCGGTTFGAVT
jgi:hypothetical protein